MYLLFAFVLWATIDTQRHRALLYRFDFEHDKCYKCDEKKKKKFL